MPYYRVVLNNDNLLKLLEMKPDEHVSPTTHMIYLEPTSSGSTDCPQIYIWTPQIEVCSGTTITIYSSIVGTVSAIYQWYLNGETLMGETDPNFTYIPSDGDEVYCTLLGDTCGNISSNKITLIVDSLCTPSIRINYQVIKGDGMFQQAKSTICSGDIVIFSGNTTCSGTRPIFSWWKKNGLGSWSLIHGETSLMYSYEPIDNDQIKCEMISNEKCITVSAVTSNIITLDVNPLLPVSVTVSPTEVTSCSGTTITYTATGVNEGTSSTRYKWYVNDILVQSGTAITYSYKPSNGDLVKCILTSNATCRTGSPATSNIVTNNILEEQTVVVEIESTPKSSGGVVKVTTGQSIPFSVSFKRGDCGDPTYQWYLTPAEQSPVPVGTDSPYYTLVTPTDGDAVACVLDSGCLCNDGPVYSNYITVVISGSTDKSVTIIPDDNNICTGHTVSFTATTYGFTSPSYQWHIGTTHVGSNSRYYSSNSLANGNVVTCVATESGDYTSNSITMVVYQHVTPYITITVSDNPICKNDQIYFHTQTVQNVGLNPTWQWYINYYEVGSWETIGGNQQSFTPVLGSISDHDQVKLRVVCTASEGYCPSPTYDESNTIEMTVNPIVTPSVSISTNQQLCINSAITFTATPTNGGTPQYLWYIDDVGYFLGNPFTHTFTSTASVYCIMQSTATCRTADEAVSNVLEIVECTVECLKNLMIEIYYREDYNSPNGIIDPYGEWVNGAQLNYEPVSGEPHYCNNAQYQIILNYNLASEYRIGSTISPYLGLCNMNNLGGGTYPQNDIGWYVQDGAEISTTRTAINVYFNPIADSWMGTDYLTSRYWKFVITDSLAEEILLPDGTFTITLDYLYIAEHAEAALIRITKLSDSGNILKYRGKVKSKQSYGKSYKVDPCTGTVTEINI